MNLVVIDTETGGLDPQKQSLLSLAAVLWCDRELIAETQMFICEPEIQMDSESYRIHGLQPSWLKQNGLAPCQAVEHLEDFIASHFKQTGPIVIAGHNVTFDVGFLKRLYRLADADYSRQFSHRTLDTAAIGLFMILADILPNGAASSDELFKHFQVPFGQNERHSALGDARATATLINAMLSKLDCMRIGASVT
jgi:DNA polymerase III epsilon subunit-like protein